MNILKLSLSLLIITVSLNADSYKDFSKYLKNKDYRNACIKGKIIFENNEKDEELISLIGFSCMKADYINTLGTLQSKQRKTIESRQNAVIFSSLLLQKRLIYQFMYDNTDISTLALPISEHPISKTFVAIRDNNFKIISEYPKTIEFTTDNKLYKVYINPKDRGRITIEVKDSNNNIKKHRYL